MRSRRGVTLIELLVAVSLLGLLMAGILTALHTGANAMERANSRLTDNRRLAGTARIIEQQIAGFMPVVAQCQSQVEGQPGAQLPFFEGGPFSMRFVSAYSLGEGWRGYPRILEFQIIGGEAGRGVRLIVNEHLYTGPLSAGVFCLGTVFDETLGLQVPFFRPIAAGPSSFVLADRLAAAHFSYLTPPGPQQPSEWVDRWILPRWPRAVRIELAPLEVDAVRLPPLSITAPVRVTAPPEG